VVTPGGERAYDEPWEARVFAMSEIIGTQGLGSGGGRPLREQMPPDEYLRASYYERWLWSNERRLERNGAIAPGEVDAWVERMRAGEEAPRREDPELAERVVVAERGDDMLAPAAEARFAVGDRVRTRAHAHAGHTRLPRYTRGHVGTVAAVQPAQVLPDTHAHFVAENAQHVYAVAFDSTELWGDGAESFTLTIDLYDDYLEPV
jgi:nitrile hydratase